ncbi:TPA: hypothetical protein DCP77_00200 [Candidatus Collierbacteria bacterium]|uniref:Uncharacterized protein n=1 Tax=Candidatus Collierbacteria bacterium GW2011_GWA2_42_17 TaxID=1618378 RepID=A0A0G1BZS5_9BACT|nr:MAG: hypothetical protein UU94_C0002G0090 [Candidatus Collierbacteria bacterium GW2011_GWB2_42_12]KKS42948.1 MAG: hypothetical protein UV06_C0004G0083 [Candidatus Collierbacteria bacterium GW2011_GWA2_42_17]KKS62744.1 MAG: hypothetical protein UV28_C0005G0013 [Candidatus Collierbacteria bacterium GW2011_GWE2_42_48]KKS62868.1 MAG: hypothetical protein UV29_C0009G0023 [Candidatus Collierbacteria bacterium GW2011_GWD2_42_50]KKS67376.1 MAG: hypothetical protein UV37_C0007G0012 [Candidatus Collie
MKNKPILILVVVVLSVMLSACGRETAKSFAEVNFGQLPDDSEWAGTALAYKRVGSMVGPDSPYHWTPMEVLFPDSDCVYVGYKTEKITFSARFDYEWKETDTNRYCIYKK